MLWQQKAKQKQCQFGPKNGYNKCHHLTMVGARASGLLSRCFRAASVQIDERRDSWSQWKIIGNCSVRMKCSRCIVFCHNEWLANQPTTTKMGDVKRMQRWCGVKLCGTLPTKEPASKLANIIIEWQRASKEIQLCALISCWDFFCCNHPPSPPQDSTICGIVCGCSRTPTTNGHQFE